ncbi:DeoR family transcriptional regulator [Celerinatantimonas yamalensis]|uniref:DNA-binding transcriptional regulator YciT n=1 Tax=Celerinatantimonas yamalensis TaxID=559956 RepID=A0ABW9G2V5_9GAMM
MNARRSEIIQIVNQRYRVSVTELAQHTGVSEVTIRQDLNYLEQLGYIKRIHGAAVAVDNDDIAAQMEVRFGTKQKLAERAAALVEPGETVMIEGGSTNALLARVLAERGDITLVTSSAYVAHLLRNTNADIILLGGVYQHQGESLVGSLTRYCIEKVHFSTAFIGIDGFHQDTGFTSRDMMRADVVEAILAKQKRNIILTDASKFGLIFPTTLGGSIDAFDMLVTGKDAPESDIHYLSQQDIELVTI